MDNDVQELVKMTKETLIKAVSYNLGDAGAIIVKKISDSSDTLEGLRAVVNQCEKISKLTIDADGFEKLKTICGAMLKDLDDAVDTLSSDSVSDVQHRKIRLVKAKLITIATKVFGHGVEAEKITTKLRNAPESVEGLKGSLQECEKLANLTIDPKKVSEMRLNSNRVMAEIS